MLKAAVRLLDTLGKSLTHTVRGFPRVSPMGGLNDSSVGLGRVLYINCNPLARASPTQTKTLRVLALTEGVTTLIRVCLLNGFEDNTHTDAFASFTVPKCTSIGGTEDKHDEPQYRRNWTTNPSTVSVTCSPPSVYPRFGIRAVTIGLETNARRIAKLRVEYFAGLSVTVAMPDVLAYARSVSRAPLGTIATLLTTTSLFVKSDVAIKLVQSGGMFVTDSVSVAGTLTGSVER
jgi:hypothetical protein